MSERLEQIKRLMRGHTSRGDEARILDLLRGAGTAELDGLVLELDMPRLLGDVDDHLTGPDNRTALLELLVQQRVEDLSPRARGRIALGLQLGRTSSRDEWMLLELFLSMRGAALTEFKNHVDLGGGHHDLMQIVFHDIDHAPIREQVLAHMASAAERTSHPALKILSDIDDTFLVNWKDQRFPPKTVYPGVLPFYRELDRGPGEVPDREGDLAFLSARPNDPLGVIEHVTIEMLRAAGIPTACMLGGAFRRVHSNASIAQGKYENFERYMRLFPEYDFVFVGDSGQGDAVFGRRLMKEHAEVVRGVFIHDVVATDAQGRAKWAEDGVLLFDTYAGAALLAYRKELISAEGLRRIAAHAESALQAVAFADPAMKAARQQELARDLEEIRCALQV